MNLQFSVGRQIFDSYPDAKIGVLVCRKISVKKKDPMLEDYKAAVVGEVMRKFGSEPVTRHPFIASWREMYRSFGAKPSDYRPSSEALVRRVLKTGAIPTINTAVDAYNAVSVRHLIPMGGFDIDRIQGDINLRFSEGGETFLSLGATDTEETYKGEPVYADDTKILTRRWNFRDCDETKITLETSKIAMFVDGSSVVPRDDIIEALDDLEAVLRKHCVGEYTSSIADTGNPSVSL